LRDSVSLWQWLYDKYRGEEETAPAEMSLQNQERYLIVNQQYDEDIFS
jgi:hypothetical protein